MVKDDDIVSDNGDSDGSVAAQGQNKSQENDAEAIEKNVEKDVEKEVAKEVEKEVEEEVEDGGPRENTNTGSTQKRTVTRRNPTDIELESEGDDPELEDSGPDPGEDALLPLPILHMIEGEDPLTPSKEKKAPQVDNPQKDAPQQEEGEGNKRPSEGHPGLLRQRKRRRPSEGHPGLLRQRKRRRPSKGHPGLLRQKNEAGGDVDPESTDAPESVRSPAPAPDVDRAVLTTLGGWEAGGISKC